MNLSGAGVAMGEFPLPMAKDRRRWGLPGGREGATGRPNALGGGDERRAAAPVVLNQDPRAGPADVEKPQMGAPPTNGSGLGGGAVARARTRCLPSPFKSRIPPPISPSAGARISARITMHQTIQRITLTLRALHELQSIWLS